MLLYIILFVITLCTIAGAVNLYWRDLRLSNEAHIANHITGGAHLIALAILLHALYSNQG